MEADNNAKYSMVCNNVKAQFESLNEPLHVILCVNQKTFDWLPISNEIRPYNTINWFKISDYVCAAVLNYLSNVYHNVLIPSDDGYGCDEDDCDIQIGTKIGQILAIDLTKTINHLSTICKIFEMEEKYSSQELEEFHRETDILIDEAKQLKCILCDMYNEGQRREHD